MNRYLIALFTPDAYRPSAKATISALKQTNLAETDLVILDNGYENNFCHAEAMNAVLDYARDQWVFFVDDDVLIAQPDWLQHLAADAQQSNAAIVGCVHTFATGEVNHAGAIVHIDGSTELRRSPPEKVVFAPAVSSALIGIVPGSKLRFDTRYAKYQHDLDLCLQAWHSGFMVAITPGVTVVHQMAGYYATLGQPATAYQHDAAAFREKWQEFCADGLYNIPQLTEFRHLAAQPNWELRYNAASALQGSDRAASKRGFLEILAECPHHHLRAGAHYHLYEIGGDPEHLRQTLALNPLHVKARIALDNDISSG